MFLRIAVLLMIACCGAVQACCPPGWTEFESNCYRYFSSRKSWYGAHSFCDTVGTRGYSEGTSYQTSDLASIRKSGEQSFIYNFWLSANAGEEALWIGLNDPQHNRIFRWSDGSSLTYTNWNAGEPNNHENRGEYYGTMWRSNGKWNDEHDSSSKRFGFICKMPK